MYVIGNYFSLFLRSVVTKCGPFKRNAHAIAEDIKIGFCGKRFIRSNCGGGRALALSKICNGVTKSVPLVIL